MLGRLPTWLLGSRNTNQPCFRSSLSRCRHPGAVLVTVAMIAPLPVGSRSPERGWSAGSRNTPVPSLVRAIPCRAGFLANAAPGPCASKICMESRERVPFKRLRKRARASFTAKLPLLRTGLPKPLSFPMRSAAPRCIPRPSAWLRPATESRRCRRGPLLAAKHLY
jgi:hypothetical protein